MGFSTWWGLPSADRFGLGQQSLPEVCHLKWFQPTLHTTHPQNAGVVRKGGNQYPSLARGWWEIKRPGLFGEGAEWSSRKRAVPGRPARSVFPGRFRNSTRPEYRPLSSRTLSPHEVTHHSPESCPEAMRATPSGHAVKDFSGITLARQPTRFRPPLPRDRRVFCPVRVAGERAGVRGSERARWPPHPDPLPPVESTPKGASNVGERGQTGQTTAHWRMHPRDWLP